MVTPSGSFPAGSPTAAALGASKNSHNVSFARPAQHVPQGWSVSRTLVVVGAGPKALAIHTKAAALRAVGSDAPSVVIIEDKGVAANWDGTNGYTDGRQQLVTPPEKDLGFPYRSGFGTRVDQTMVQYSWHAFLVATGRLSSRLHSQRPPVFHSDLASYLHWVSKESAADIRPGKVIDAGIESNRNEWVVRYQPSDSTACQELRANGIVITGPGSPRLLVGRTGRPHFIISNSQTFWERRRIEDFRTFLKGRIAIVGAGDTAASVVVTLLDVLPNPEQVHIDLFCPIDREIGVTASRSESLGETGWHTNPTGWDRLALTARKAYFKRTERGVFSGILKARIDAAANVRPIPAFVVDWERREKAVKVTIESNGRREHFPGPYYNRLVVATGFKRWSFSELFREKSEFPPSFPAIHVKGAKFDNEVEEAISMRIKTDLSYTNDRGWPSAKLYLPILAGLQCGPGFPNLGCLGLLSDRIIGSVL